MPPAIRLAATVVGRKRWASIQSWVEQPDDRGRQEGDQDAEHEALRRARPHRAAGEPEQRGASPR